MRASARATRGARRFAVGVACARLSEQLVNFRGSGGEKGYPRETKTQSRARATHIHRGAVPLDAVLHLVRLPPEVLIREVARVQLCLLVFRTLRTGLVPFDQQGRLGQVVQGLFEFGAQGREETGVGLQGRGHG